MQRWLFCIDKWSGSRVLLLLVQSKFARLHIVVTTRLERCLLIHAQLQCTLPRCVLRCQCRRPGPKTPRRGVAAGVAAFHPLLSVSPAGAEDSVPGCCRRCRRVASVAASVAGRGRRLRAGALPPVSPCCIRCCRCRRPGSKTPRRDVGTCHRITGSSRHALT